MNVFQQLALTWQALVRASEAPRSRAFWVPALILVAFQIVVVLALWLFAHPLVSWGMAPLLRRLAGEDVLHYPNVLHTLPRLLTSLDRVILATLGTVLWGAATVMFAERFRRGTPSVRAALRLALRRLPALAFAGVPGVVLVWAVVWGLALALRPSDSGGIRTLLFGFMAVGATVLVRSLFLFVPALVVLEGRSAFRAWGELPQTWRRAGWSAMFLVLVVTALEAVIGRVWGAASALETRFGPEAMVALAVAEIVLGLVPLMLLWGGATLIYFGLAMEFDEWDP